MRLLILPLILLSANFSLASDKQDLQFTAEQHIQTQLNNGLQRFLDEKEYILQVSLRIKK